MHAVPTICIILPCYNEESMLPFTVESLLQYVKKLVNEDEISEKSYLCFVDDGSKDNTWRLIEVFSTKHTCIKGIKLSTNFGHQNALIAGLFTEKRNADCFITIDADLQDDITAIGKMVEKYKDGFEIVYGVRDNRENDTFFKRFTAQSFYRLMGGMGVKTIYNHADFRLVSKNVADHFERFGEVNLFLRGLFPILGFNSTNVYYQRGKRPSGESKYPIKKMLRFAWQGITSFSTMPLQLISYLGGIMFSVSLILSIWIFISYLRGNTIQGWASMILLMTMFFGVTMISLGIIGEYVGKIYMEVKCRPRFIIEKETKQISEYEQGAKHAISY